MRSFTSSPLCLAVLVEVEDRAVAAFGHQPEPPRDFLIGFDFAAQILAEAILVELLVRWSCPTGGSRPG